jgi:hypothetical protein
LLLAEKFEQNINFHFPPEEAPEKNMLIRELEHKNTSAFFICAVHYVHKKQLTYNKELALRSFIAKADICRVDPYDLW